MAFGRRCLFVSNMSLPVFAGALTSDPVEHFHETSRICVWLVFRVLSPVFIGENLPSGLLKVSWYLLDGPFGTLYPSQKT
jgi:hypothetical protein